MSPTGRRDTSTVKHKQDFGVIVGYKDQPSANVPTLQYTIVGVKAFYNSHSERGATDAAVKRTLLYSGSGWASATEAAVVGTVKNDSLTASASEEPKVKDKPKKPVEKVELTTATLITEPVTVKPMSLDEKKAARTRLVPLSSVASISRECEEGSNNLAGFLYYPRFLLSDSDISPLNRFSTTEERA